MATYARRNDPLHAMLREAFRIGSWQVEQELGYLFDVTLKSGRVIRNFLPLESEADPVIAAGFLMPEPVGALRYTGVTHCDVTMILLSEIAAITVKEV